VFSRQPSLFQSVFSDKNKIAGRGKNTEVCMVDLSILGGNLVLHVRGADKLWAFKSSLEIPLAHIAEIRRTRP